MPAQCRLVSAACETSENEDGSCDVLTRNLEDMACANAEELRAALPGFGMALAWPGGGR